MVSENYIRLTYLDSTSNNLCLQKAVIRAQYKKADFFALPWSRYNVNVVVCVSAKHAMSVLSSSLIDRHL